MPPPVVIKIGAVADLHDIAKTKLALASLGDSSKRLNRIFRGLASGLARVMKTLGKISFIGMAIDIGLVSTALASVRLMMAVGRWSVRTYEAALRGLGVTAGMVASALTAVVAAMREFTEVSFAPIIGGMRQAQQALRAGMSDDLLSYFGVTGIQQAAGELARSGVSIQRSYTGILRQLGNFSADAQTLAQLAAVWGEVNRQGRVTEDVMGRLIQINPVFARAAAEMMKGTVFGPGQQVKAEDIAMEFAAAGKISAQQFARMFSGELTSTDLWENQLDSLSDTLFGQVKSMVSGFYQLFSDIGGPILKALKPVLAAVERITRATFVGLSGVLSKYGIQTMLPGFLSGYEKFMRWSSRTIIEGLQNIGGFMGRMRDMWQGVKSWFIDVKDALAPLEEGGRIIGKVLGPAFRELFGGTGGIGGLIREFNALLIQNQALFEKHGAVLARFVRSFMDIFHAGQEAFTKALPAINKFISAITENVMPVVREMISLFKDAVVSVLPALGDAFKYVADMLRPILSLLNGIVGAGGSLGLVGGAGLLMAPWLLGMVGKGGKTMGAAGAAARGTVARGVGGVATRAGGYTPLLLAAGLGLGGAAAGTSMAGGAAGAGIATGLATLGVMMGLTAGSHMGTEQKPLTVNLSESFVRSPRGMSLLSTPQIAAFNAAFAAAGSPRTGIVVPGTPGGVSTVPVATALPMGRMSRTQAALFDYDVQAGMGTPPSGNREAWARRRALASGYSQFGGGTLGLGLMMTGQSMPGLWGSGLTAGGTGLMMTSMGGGRRVLDRETGRLVQGRWRGYTTASRIGAGMAGYQLGSAAGQTLNMGSVVGGLVGSGVAGLATGGLVGGAIGLITGGIGALMGWRQATEKLKKAQEAASKVSSDFAEEIFSTFATGGTIDDVTAYQAELQEMMTDDNLRQMARDKGVDETTFVRAMTDEYANMQTQLTRSSDRYWDRIYELTTITGKSEGEIKELANTMNVDLMGAGTNVTQILHELGFLSSEFRSQVEADVEAIQNMLGSLTTPGAGSRGYELLAGKEAKLTVDAVVEELVDSMRSGAVEGPSTQQFNDVVGGLFTWSQQTFGKDAAVTWEIVAENLRYIDTEVQRLTGRRGVFAELFEPRLVASAAVGGLNRDTMPLETREYFQSWFRLEMSRLQGAGFSLDAGAAGAKAWENWMNVELPKLENMFLEDPENYYARLMGMATEAQSLVDTMDVIATTVNVLGDFKAGLGGMMPGQLVRDVFSDTMSDSGLDYLMEGGLSGFIERVSSPGSNMVEDAALREIKARLSATFGPEVKDKIIELAEAGVPDEGIIRLLDDAYSDMLFSTQGTQAQLDLLSGDLVSFSSAIATAMSLIPGFGGTSKNAGKVPKGVSPSIGGTTDSDTSTERFSRVMRFHTGLNSRFAGGRLVTSGLRNWNLGSVNSDHLTGSAYDLTGDNLGAYAEAVRAYGGFAEFHGHAGGRHLHVVAPIGDRSSAAITGSSAAPMFGSVAININGAEASPEAIANAVIGKLRRLERDARERE